MEPKRVLHIVTKMDRAGLETMLMNYYRYIDRSKLQFDFLTHRQEKGDYDDEILALGGRIYRTYPMHPQFFMHYIKSNKIFFIDHPEYQVVHSHLDALSFLPLYAAKKAEVPVRIAHSHINNFDRDKKLPVRLFFKRLIPSVATHFWGCSAQAIDFMFGQNQNNQRVISNAIDSDKFSFDPLMRDIMRASLNLEDKFVIGHVGRFARQKNHFFLIDVFYKLYCIEPRAVLLLIGKGEDEPKIQEMVRALGIESSVFFLGTRSDIPQLMQAMDVFLFPSLFEGLGIVLVEAQAAGLPCYTSANVVPPAAKVTGLLQYISLSQSPQYWAEQIMARNKEPRQNLEKKIQVAGYDIAEQAKSLQDIYISQFGCARKERR